MAISGTMETPIPVPTMLRMLLNWPLSKIIWGLSRAAIACSDGRVPEAVSIPEKKERFGAEILERKRTMASEFVVFGESGEKTLGEERKGFKLVPADG